MSVLSAQSIRRLCILPKIDPVFIPPEPLITPFTERRIVNGKSFGLSACTYDCRIDQDLTLEPMPFWLIAAFMRDASMDWSTAATMAAKVTDTKFHALASTIERFNIPYNICGSVLDKSTYARVFISAFNTHLDPGWNGFLTVELVNLGDTTVEYIRGDPVCQVKFEWLDEPTELPYIGRKYSDQPARPVPSINEEDSNSI